MKAFILVALAASVAARSLDLETLQKVNQKNVLTTPVGPLKVVDDALLKEEQLKNNVIVGQGNIPIDTTVFGGNVDVDRVLTFQEIYTTTLFKEYLNLPLFRQYVQYPMFQRFVGSVYFQRFWQLPAYKQYFVNPVLFYKYVYPVVQVFKTEYTIPTVYGQEEDVLGLQTMVDEVVKNKNFVPYANNRFTIPTAAFPETTNYKFLLEKMYKTLFVNQPVVGEVTQVKTDVKMVPQKVVVEPFTNQVTVQEPKIVDVQVDQQVVPVETVIPTDKVVDTVVLTETDVLLLKELLQKNIITPEVYQTVLVGKLNYATVLKQVLVQRGITADLFNQVVARLQVVDTVVPVTPQTGVLTERNIVILKDLFQKNIITPEVYQAVLLGKFDFTTVLRQVLVQRGITEDLVTLIVNRLINVDTVVPFLTEQDKLLVKELFVQKLITPEVYQAVVIGKVDLFTILRQVVVTRTVVDTIVPFTTDSVVLNERTIVILKDLVQRNIITQDVFQAVLLGKIDFTTILRQVLVQRGITTDLVTLIVNRLVTIDTVAPVLTEQDTFLFKELLRQNVITPQIYQTVLLGKVDLFTILRQVITRRDVIDTIVPVDTTVVLTERNIVLLKDLFRQNIINQEVFQAVLVGKIDFSTILRQVLVQRGVPTELITLIINRLVTFDTVAPVTTQQDVFIVRELLRQNLISTEIYQAVLVGKVDIFTVLRQVVLRGVLVDNVTPYTNIFNDRASYINNLFGIKRNIYNTEIPTIRNNMFNRFPIVA